MYSHTKLHQHPFTKKRTEHLVLNRYNHSHKINYNKILTGGKNKSIVGVCFIPEVRNHQDSEKSVRISR